MGGRLKLLRACICGCARKALLFLSCKVPRSTGLVCDMAVDVRGNANGVMSVGRNSQRLRPDS